MTIEFLNSSTEKIIEFNYEDYRSIKIIETDGNINMIVRKKWDKNDKPIKLKNLSDVSIIKINDEITKVNIISQEIYVHKIEDVYMCDVIFSIEIAYDE